MPLFRQQIAAGGPVTVTHPDVRRYFMTIPEAARLVVQAGAIGQSGQVLVLDMGEPVRIVDLATDMIRLSGLRVGEDVAMEFTGLRPGEKLYEELHVPGEQRLPTSHSKIIVANHRPPQVDDLRAPPWPSWSGWPMSPRRPSSASCSGLSADTGRAKSGRPARPPRLPKRRAAGEEVSS